MAIHHEAAYARPRSAAAAHRRGGARRLLLPLFPGLSDDAQDYVIDRLGAHVVAQAA